mgnify:CR=1 FL=1
MAAANLGSLVATVAANTKPFQSGMKRANGMLSQLGQKLGLTDKQLKTMAKAAAAAAASFFAFHKVRDVIGGVAQEIDDLAKRARALGAEVNQVAALSFASQLAGGDTQRFFSTIGRLMLNLGQGSETTRIALNSLGLELDDLANMNPVQAFMALQEALEGVENQQERMAIIALIAGGRMENMIPLMNMLGQDIEGFMERHGELMGMIETQGWEDYVDALTMLQTAWLGLKVTLFSIVLPVFKAITDALTAIIATVRKAWPLIRNLAIAAAFCAAKFIILRTAQLALITVSLILAKTVKLLIIMFNALGKTLAAASMNWVQFAAMVAKMTVVLIAVGAAISEIKDLEEAVDALNEAEDENGGFGDLLKNARELEALAQTAQQWLSELRTPEEIFADTLNELALIKAKFEELGLTAQQAQLIWNRGVASALKTLLESKKVMDSIRQAGSLKLGTMAEASGRMAAERQQQRQTEYLDAINQAMATANDILADIRDNIQPPPGNVPALP